MKNHDICIRLDSNEKERVRLLAQQYGFKHVSEFVRKKIFDELEEQSTKFMIKQIYDRICEQQESNVTGVK